MAVGPNRVHHTLPLVSQWQCGVLQRRSQGGAWRGSTPPLSNENIDVYFLVFHQHCTVSREQVHCKMFFGSTTGVTTHTLSNQAVMNFRDLRNIEAAFLHSCVFCATIYNKSWVLPCSASAELCQCGNKHDIWTTNSVDWCVVHTSQSWDLPNVHTWMICISVTISDVLREISDIWCFGSISDVDWAVVSFPKFYILLGWR